MIQRSKRSVKIDPLELLREFTMNKKEILFQKRDQILQFDQTKLDLKTPTAWRKNTGGYYSLGDLWLFLQKVEKSLPMRVYFQQRQEYTLEGIEKIEEDEIINFFQGTVDTSDKIDQEAKQQLLAQKKSRPSEGNSQQEGGASSKKLKTNEGEAKTAEMTLREHNIHVISWIMKTEKPLTSKTRLLRSKFAVNLNVKQFLKYLEEGKGGSSASVNQLEQKSSINYPCLFKDLKDKRQKPIIIVPTMGRAGNISLFNSKQFLSEGKYDDPENKDYNNSERVVQFERTIKGHPFVFEVYDNVSSFEAKMNSSSKSKWERVVGVFVTGQKYQFKDWPKEDNIPSILDSVKGFYLKYSEAPIPDQVNNWNVKVINVYRHKRHQDKPAQEVFWTDLENFMIQPRNRSKQ